jgi:hypothetical protein
MGDVLEALLPRAGPFNNEGARSWSFENKCVPKLELGNEGVQARDRVFEAWNLELLWSLELGVWSFGKTAANDQFAFFHCPNDSSG